MADDTSTGPWNDYAAPAAAAPDAPAGPWNDYAKKPEIDVGKDITQGATQNAIPTAAANIGAVAVNPAYTMGSYALQLGTKAGEFVGEGGDSLLRAAQGEPQKTQKQYDAEQLDLMNAIRGHLGMKPATSGDLAGLVPTPQNMLEKGVEAVGHPLYQPQTTPGRLTTEAANIASGGVGSDMKLVDALSGAFGATTFQEVVKQLGGPEAAQFAAAMLGGGLAAKGSEMGLHEDNAVIAAEDARINTIFGADKPPSKNPDGLGAQELREMASPAYRYAERKGAVMTPDLTGDVLETMKGNVDESPRVTRALGQTKAQQMAKGLDDEYNGTPMSFNDATDIVKRFNDAINGEVQKNGKLSDVGRQMYAMKTDFIKQISEAGDNGQVTGGPAAIEAWKHANDLWSRSMRAGEVERIIERGSMMDNPDTSIRLGFRNLYNNKKALKSYLPQEQEYIKAASETSAVGELMRAASSRLFSQGMFATGNFIGGLAGNMAATGVRAIAARARMGQGQKIVDEIVNNAKPYQPPPEPLMLPPPQLKLPPPSGSDQFMAGPTVGDIRPLGGSEAFARNQQRDAIAALGRTPDVEAAGAQHPAAAPEPPEVTQARQSLQDIADGKPVGTPAAQPAQFRPQTDQSGQVPIPPGQGPLQWDAQGRPSRAPAALPPPKPGNEMIAGPEGVRPSTQSEDWQNAQMRQKDAEMGITPDIRAAIQQHMRPKIQSNLSAATGTIPGLDNLVKSANSGDAGAHTMLNNIAQDGLERLMSGIPGARVDVTPASGLYGGSLEPSIGATIHFNEYDRPAVMAALAKFGENFNQHEVHAREIAPEGHKPGTQYGDGSFATPVHRYNLKQPLSRAEIEKVANDAGLDGFTATDKTLETYYAGDPNDNAAIKKFVAATGKAEASLGDRIGSNSSTIERLWRTGSATSDPYAGRIEGNFRTPTQTTSDIPRQIAERNVGSPITPAVERPITAKQKALQEQIAKIYDKLPENDLKNPVVQKAYTALAHEVKSQFQSLPIKVDVWKGKGEPYTGSADMRKDLLNNNHLYIYKTTPETFGPAGSDFSDHPLLQDSGMKSANGQPLLMNDLLRAVHDYYAHATSPVSFSPKGEEAAWKNHMASTKDPWARWALTSETRGQNSWVNFRPEAEGKPLSERPFAVQKAALMPLKYAMTGDPKVDEPMKRLFDALVSGDRQGSMRKYASGGRVSDAQASAGNYKKEHIIIGGLPISIENKAGSIRRGKDNAWQVKMPCDYGYFKRTEGADGDHVDCFVGPHRKSDKVYVINQVDHGTKKFDEHKVMLGFASEKQARAYYEKSYSDGKGKARIGSLRTMNIHQLKEWLRNGDTVKALAA